jgi:hypothetical protein
MMLASCRDDDNRNYVLFVVRQRFGIEQKMAAKYSHSKELEEFFQISAKGHFINIG